MSTVPARRLGLLVAGFCIWALAFIALYAVNAIGCRFEWSPAIQRGALLAMLFVHLIVLASLTVWTAARWRRMRESITAPAALLEYLGLGTTLAAFGATVFVLAPAAAISLCL